MQKTPSVVSQNLDKRRKNSVHSLGTAEVEAIQTMFDEYRRESRASASEVSSMRTSSTGQRHIMTKEGLQRCLKDVDAKLFDFLWKLFDSDGTGSVDADEFVKGFSADSSSGN